MSGILTKYYASPNILPPPTAATSGEIDGITYNIGADGVCTFSGIASSDVSITVDLSSSFVIPIAVSAGGSGTIAFNNSKALNAYVRFYNGDTLVTEWGLSSINRTSTNYSTMGGKTVTKYIFRIVSGVNANGLSVAVAISNNGIPVSPFEPYTTEVWKDIPYSKLETATDVVTSLPVTVYGDGETDISLLLKGNTETSGTASPQNPITIDGVGNKTANLLNPEGNWTDFNCTHTISGGDITVTGVWFSYLAFTAKPNTTYGIKYNNVLNQHVAVYKNTVSGSPLATTYTDFIKFTTDTDTQLHIVFYANSGSTERTVEYKNVRLFEGDYTSQTIPDYEPYGKYKVSILKDSQPLTPMYFSQQLMSISSGSTVFKDEYNSSGTATYILKKKVFDGTESIGFNQLPYCILSGLRTFGLAFCTHFKYVQKSVRDTMLNGECTTYLGSGVAIWFCLDNITSADDFKAFLAQEYANGTPVTVYYVLATAETESVTAPTITTTGGEVSIDVDTTVKPSEMSLTYHGWHTHEPLKRENGQWF